MKKFIPILWIIILIGIGFVAYNYFSPEGTPEEHPEETTQDPDQAYDAPRDTNETYTSLIQKGDTYFEKAYFQEANDLYQKALINFPDSTEALYKIGLTHLLDNNSERARGYFEQVKIKKDTTEINVLIGRTYLNERNIEIAKEHFDKLEFSNNEVKYYRAVINILYKQHDDAKEIFAGLIDETAEIEPEIKIKAGVYLDAYSQFNTYRDGKPPHIDTLLSKALIATGEYESAIPLLFNAINSQNNYRDAWIMLGYSYLKTNKLQDATDALLQAKSLDPNKPETLFFLGVTYAVQDRLDDALFYLEKAQEAGFEPKIQIDQKLADIYLLKEDYEKALQKYDDITLLNTEDLSIFAKAVWICIEKLDKPQKAIGIAERAVHSHPEEAMSYNLRGWSFVAYDDYDRAKEDLTKAIQLDSSLAQTYLNIGWMFEKQDQTQIAKEYYKKAHSLDPDGSVANISVIRFNNIKKKELSSKLKANITSP
ncbi:tetratricopeptide repeat protein [Candidatus Peregrinibacteria bacterium]|nr:tetratricopeptide repeat protein [Candidatus Peregrinibacteria bacterium]MBT4056261.1 tetratricopeptide repeat protein [Candidatus Peregrinibacteria bacterium]